MELINQEFEKIKGSDNPEAVNDFLIRLSENPNKEFLKFIDYFLNETEEGLYEKIKLNLVYTLGEIGSLTKLTDDYLQKIIDIYYRSDQWIRNEIIQAINKISKESILNESIISLLGSALNDDYLPVKISALQTINNIEILPDPILIPFFRVLNSKESEVIDLCRKILERVPLDKIFTLLNTSENYKVLKSRAIRTLLLINFRSILNLEAFREKVFDSGWENSYKEKFLKEIETLQRILLKTM